MVLSSLEFAVARQIRTRNDAGRPRIGAQRFKHGTMMHDLNDMRLFVQVAQAGGFAKASRATGVPRATLSRRIIALEDAMRLRLIERTSRSFRLTSAGEAFFERAKAAVDMAEEAFACGADAMGEPVGTVRFAVPQSLLRLGLDKMVQEYLANHPRVSIQI